MQKINFFICIVICGIIILAAITPISAINNSSGPELEVGLYTSISFSFNYEGLQIYVKNIGDETAHNIKLINLSIDGHVLYNNRVTEWDRDIEPGHTLIDSPHTMFIGIGVFTATMTVTCDENIISTGSGNGFILGMFIFVP